MNLYINKLSLRSFLRSVHNDLLGFEYKNGFSIVRLALSICPGIVHEITNSVRKWGGEINTTTSIIR